MKKLLPLLLMLCLSVTATWAQGVTSSSLNGQVTDNANEPLPSANVVAVHTPSGTSYGAISDFDGYYRISNMRVGGPYTVTISYVGFEDIIQNDIYLQLGESQKISVALAEQANALSEVIITAQGSGLDTDNTGAETKVSRRQVTTLPSLSRNIADFARLTPQAKISGDDVISISGQNNRYNAIFIDGAVSNDVFGLAGNGTNGGQTGVSPISLDAIDSYQINVSPFDVKQSGFAGGSISAITKSGTNTTEGSAYSFLRNESLAGKTPVDLVSEGQEREKLSEFTALTYGVRVGGPIIKDKLFYFVNYERQDNETPQPFDIGTYRGSATAGDLQQLSDYLLNNFGYDAGGYANNTASLESDKFIAKLDWNINSNNTLSLKHSYVKAIQLDARASNTGSINFLNGAINFESITNSTALEFNSRIGNKFSNNLVLGYTSVNDDRNPNGSPFPSVQIFDSAGTSIFFGSEPFSTANLLEQRVFTVTDNFEIYAGKQTITIGTSNEFSHSKNVFFRQNFGDYRYSSLEDFLNNARPNRFRYGYSLLGGLGDESEGAAEFDFYQLGLYVQDEIQFKDNFKVSLGVRFDVPFWEDGLVNEDFNTRTIDLLQANGKDLQGAKVGQGIDASVHVSPRIGFNWDVNGQRKTVIRGGLGIFTSRIPLVWPGATYNNNGLTAGFVELTGANAPLFNPDTTNQLEGLDGVAQPGSGTVGGQIDLFAKGFKLPQVFKTNIAVDQKLGAGFNFSADFIWNDNINAVTYENINLEGPQFQTTGAGARPNYGFKLIDPTYAGVFLGSNTGAGSSYNISGTLSNNFITDKFDIRTSATYSYGDSDVILDGTSSQNSSQWQNLETVNGSNRPVLSTSDFSPGHRIIANSTIEFKWTENTKTRVGLFYEGAEGSPFSYVYNGGGLLADTGSFAALIYVPANQSEIIFRPITNSGGDIIATPAQQWEALNSFITSDEYLSSRRGDFAERNADRSDWSHIIDLKFAQEFGVKIGKNSHKLEISFDIFNFTNLLNKEWGVRTFTNFNQVQLLNFRGFGADGTTPEFTYDSNVSETKNIIDDSGLNSSRWQMQAGLRYSFN